MLGSVTPFLLRGHGVFKDVAGQPLVQLRLKESLQPPQPLGRLAFPEVFPHLIGPGYLERVAFMFAGVRRISPGHAVKRLPVFRLDLPLFEVDLAVDVPEVQLRHDPGPLLVQVVQHLLNNRARRLRRLPALVDPGLGVLEYLSLVRLRDPAPDYLHALCE